MPNTNTDMTEMQLPNGNSGQLSEQFRETGKSVYHTFDAISPKGATMLFAAKFGEPKKLGDMIGEKITIQDYYAHEVESADDESGEVKAYIRIVLFSPKGEAYSCGSSGVRDSLAMIASIRGHGTLKPPVVCTIKSKTVGVKKRFMWLEPDIDSLLNRNATTPGER